MLTDLHSNYLTRHMLLKVCLGLLQERLATVIGLTQGGNQILRLKRHVKLKVSNVVTHIFLRNLLIS